MNRYTCLACCNNLIYVDQGEEFGLGHFERFYCPTCESRWKYYEPNELTAVEEALVQEALSDLRFRFSGDCP